ncbi:MAG: TolC family protein [Gammaproteobacteria bacterium]|uniref:TolC family protein n=1 Tax=Acinetobacter TaxID=469 RepID=UPI00131547A0|nr:TolC family protein [Acinetobacter indicus]MDD4854045.1 TolC family protein [Acinetobacter towneri]NLN56532.1 TolC family protein [Gammaproteobacteria bacterium]
MKIFPKFSKKIGEILILLSLYASSQAHAVELRTILKNALQQDPLIIEAQANEQAAISKVKESQALHYPVLAVTANQILDQSHDNRADYASENFTPGLRGTLNLYSFGAISAQVERDKSKSAYFHEKTGETAEELGYSIGSEYIKALRAQESLEVQNRSLERHNKFTRDIGIIVQYDQGRRSELIQAKARQMQVEHIISGLQRELGFALSNLKKYAPHVDPAGLSDPFAQFSISNVVDRYSLADSSQHPSYQAQQAELDSIRSEHKYRQTKRYPSINLEGNVTTEDRQIYLSMAWDVFNQGNKYSVEQGGQSIVAAQARLGQIQRDIEERARTAEIDMFQSKQKMEITRQQIAASRDVVIANEKQFKIARKTLVDVLNAYNELSAVEIAYVTAQNDFRMAALAYLRAQGKISTWAVGSSHSTRSTQP